MVGIPGRSKACRTCLRRRKACDLRHPVCKACERLGLECEWAKAQAIFINNTTTTAALTKPPSNGSAPTRPFAAPISIPLSLPAEYEGIFWDHYLPKGCPIPPDMAISPMTVWARNTPHHSQVQALFHVALMATSNCMVGARDKNSGGYQQGLQLYGQALQQLQVILRDVAKADPEVRLGLMMTGGLLALFEVFFGSNAQNHAFQGQAWWMHSSAQLLLLAGTNPRMFARGNAHQVFVNSRQHLTFHDIVVRKASILARPEWKTLPWLHTPKTPTDFLVDIFVELPGLLQQLDTLRRSHPGLDNTSLSSELARAGQTVRDDLQQWYSAVGEALLSLVGRAMDQEGTPSLMKHAGNVRAVLLYWCCLLVYSEVHQAIEELDLAPHMQRCAFKDSDAVHAKSIAIMKFMLSSDEGWLGYNVVVLPLSIVFNCFQQGSCTVQLADILPSSSVLTKLAEDSITFANSIASFGSAERGRLESAYSSLAGSIQCLG